MLISDGIWPTSKKNRQAVASGLISRGTPNLSSFSRWPRDLEAFDFLLQFSFIFQYIRIVGCFYLASSCN